MFLNRQQIIIWYDVLLSVHGPAPDQFMQQRANLMDCEINHMRRRYYSAQVCAQTLVHTLFLFTLKVRWDDISYQSGAGNTEHNRLLKSGFFLTEKLSSLTWVTLGLEPRCSGSADVHGSFQTIKVTKLMSYTYHVYQ